MLLEEGHAAACSSRRRRATWHSLDGPPRQFVTKRQRSFDGVEHAAAQAPTCQIGVSASARSARHRRAGK
jgi:hypothetical protein